jgi:peptidyl-prolyl cis-trans isomerase B (cyclophilin B)
MLYRLLLLGILAGLVLVSCSKKACEPLTMEEIQELINTVQEMPLEPVAANEVAVMKTNLGTMVIEFFPDKAPQHCAYFKRLVNAGFYTCTKFHRVIKNFMIQGGDILTRDATSSNDGGGSPGYRIAAEFNDIPHDKGILSMARGREPDTAGSQFFICHTRQGTKGLDGQYTVFGRVIEGLEVIDLIADSPLTRSEVYGDDVLPDPPVFIEEIYMEIR